MSKYYYATIDSINGLLSYKAESQEEVKEALIDELEAVVEWIHRSEEESTEDNRFYYDHEELERVEQVLKIYKNADALDSASIKVYEDEDFCNIFIYAKDLQRFKELLADTEDMTVEEYEDRYGWGNLK